MALKIIKASEPIEVKTITACLYAQPGIGKTSMACTAEKPLTLAFDNGVYRSKFRKDVVRVSSWEDVTEITAEDLKPYKTLIVDTVGSALDFLTVQIIKDNPKAGNGGALSQNGFGILKSKFGAWSNLIRSFGLDLILVAHMEEQKKGDEIAERLDIQGGSKGTVYKGADLMGRIYLVNGKRTLNFSPTDTGFGKNPAEFPVLDVPDYKDVPDFFATVIAKTKAEINKLNAEQTRAQALLAEWTDRVLTATTPEAINALLEPARNADELVRDNAKRLVSKAAKVLGLTYDQAAGVFVAPAAKLATATSGEGAGAGSASPADPSEAKGRAAQQEDPRAVTAGASASPASAPSEREPGSDDGDEDAANRKAAEPTQTEIAAHEAEKTTTKSKKKAA